MKKITFLLTAGMILFASCSQNISSEENEQKRVSDSLDLYLKKQIEFSDYKSMTGIYDSDKAYRAYTADSMGLDSASKVKRIEDENIKAPSWAK